VDDDLPLPVRGGYYLISVPLDGMLVVTPRQGTQLEFPMRDEPGFAALRAYLTRRLVPSLGLAHSARSSPR
jgi:hypothetical protein